ncbi:MAG: hypothetical protein HY344_04030 [Candidatus Levybacteria bacterium]|nr:hypothetical protein [Candidatus Levybacteria bacterium]
MKKELVIAAAVATAGTVGAAGVVQAEVGLPGSVPSSECINQTETYVADPGEQIAVSAENVIVSFGDGAVNANGKNFVDSDPHTSTLLVDLNQPGCAYNLIANLGKSRIRVTAYRDGLEGADLLAKRAARLERAHQDDPHFRVLAQSIPSFVVSNIGRPVGSSTTRAR